MGRAMSEPIKVTQEFLDEFQELCGLIGLQPDEVEDLRRVIRADFESGRRWVAMTLWVRRYCLKKWGRLPTVDECREVLGPDADPGWFQREGILILAGRCAGKEKFPIQ